MKKLMIICFYLSWLFSGNALALTDDQIAAVRDMGMLNGIALHCGYYDQTRIMKKNLVEILPKKRELGLAFDEASNESFLAFIDKKEKCPGAVSLMERVNKALQSLRTKFPRY